MNNQLFVVEYSLGKATSEDNFYPDYSHGVHDRRVNVLAPTLNEAVQKVLKSIALQYANAQIKFLPVLVSLKAYINQDKVIE